MSPNGHCRLTQCLRARWMGMAGQCDVFRRGGEFHRYAILRDHLADAWTDQVNAEDFISALIRQYFREAIGFVVDLGATVGAEGEFAHLVSTPFLLELFFRLTDAGQFGLGVDDIRDEVVVELALFADN